MLELPESVAVAGQMQKELINKRITDVIAGHTPHGFAAYFGEPAGYPALLQGKTIDEVSSAGGMIEISLQNTRLLINDGVGPRWYQPGSKMPNRHQLFLRFEDGSALICVVQMYGGMMAYPQGSNHSPYYLAAKEKPSPLTIAFDQIYFEALAQQAGSNLSVKAFLATEQRIPGLGNGCLQDILLKAGIHPRTKLSSLSSGQWDSLYSSVKTVMKNMAEQGGRDTEKDLYGQWGGYHVLLSRKTRDEPCPVCGSEVVRQSYLGGNVYFCPNCQPLCLV